MNCSKAITTHANALLKSNNSVLMVKSNSRVITGNASSYSKVFTAHAHALLKSNNCLSL